MKNEDFYRDLVVIDNSAGVYSDADVMEHLLYYLEMERSVSSDAMMDARDYVDGVLFEKNPDYERDAEFEIADEIINALIFELDEYAVDDQYLSWHPDHPGCLLFMDIDD